MTRDEAMAAALEGCPQCRGTGSVSYLTRRGAWGDDITEYRPCSLATEHQRTATLLLNHVQAAVKLLRDKIDEMEVGVAAGDDVRNIMWCAQCGRYGDARDGCPRDMRDEAERRGWDAMAVAVLALPIQLREVRKIAALQKRGPA